MSVTAFTTERGRLEAFSDGVLAVAITLLAFDLPVGNGRGSLALQLVHMWPAWLAYGLSFFTIGIIWINHHALFGVLARFDNTILFLNLLVLMFVVAIPFATLTLAKYLAHGGENANVAAALYGAIMTGMSISFGLILHHALGQSLTHTAVPRRLRRIIELRFSIGAVVYFIGSGLALWNAALALGCFGAVALYYAIQQVPVKVLRPELANLPSVA
jgi:uncharacterized membrane protein